MSVDYATSDVPQIRAYAQIANQDKPWIPLETFEVQLAAYGSIGHFACTTAISSLEAFGWGVNTKLGLLGVEIENSQPSLYDGSPTYPIKLYATGAYDPAASNPSTYKKAPTLIFAGDIDSLEWDFDHDQLRISGRDYGGRLHDWMAVLDKAWMNMDYAAFAAFVIANSGLTPHIATSSTVNQSLRNLLFQIGTSNIPGLERLGYNKSPLSDSYSAWTSPQNMWDLLNTIARSIGFIVTVHNDGVVYVGPQGGDSEVNAAPRTFTWFASETTKDIVPVRNLTIDHGPRQYGTFAIRGFSFHPPSVTVSSTSVMAFSGNKRSFVAAGVARQPLTAGVYKQEAANAGFAAGKPNYYFYFQGKTPPQVKAEALGLAFDIARNLYVVHGEVDGDPTLVPTTPIQLDEAVPNYLQGYANKALTLASVNHTFDMENGFLTQFTAWYAPSPQELPTAPGEYAGYLSGP